MHHLIQSSCNQISILFIFQTIIPSLLSHLAGLRSEMGLISLIMMHKRIASLRQSQQLLKAIDLPIDGFILRLCNIRLTCRMTFFSNRFFMNSSNFFSVSELLALLDFRSIRNWLFIEQINGKQHQQRVLGERRSGRFFISSLRSCRALRLAEGLLESYQSSKKRDCSAFSLQVCVGWLSSSESLSLALKISSCQSQLSYSSSSIFTFSSSSEDSSKHQESLSSSSKRSSSSFFTPSSSSHLVQNSDFAYILISSSLAPFAILFLSILSLNLSYQPLLKLKVSLPGILRSSMICFAWRMMCFLFILGLLRMKLASLISISGQRALLPPYFFLSYFVWYHLVKFLGCIFYSLALALIIFDKHSLELSSYSLI